MQQSARIVSTGRTCAARLLKPALSAFLLTAIPACGAPRSAIFLLGPAGAEHAREAARAAASASRRWLHAPDSTAELRRAGSLEGLQLDSRVPSKSVEQAFLDAARQGRDSDPAVFLSALDAAAQALARRPGLRLLVAVAESPSLSSDGETMLKQIVEFCQSSSVRVIVVDPADASSRIAKSSLEPLGAGTGGVLIRSAKALDSHVLMVAAASREAESAAAVPSPAKSALAEELPALGTDLPVHTRFFRTSPRGSQFFGTQRSFGVGIGGATVREGGPGIEDTTGPMRGFLIVESPLSALHFDIDKHAGTYAARTRVTQMARNESGKIVWRAKKEVNLQGPLAKLARRQGGNLYYLRDVLLPAGHYTLEATVEDLLSGKSGGVREPLRTSMGIPGFTASDAMFVRPFNGAVDKFEADQVLGYDGNAISPLLVPVYHAGEPFDLQIYFLIYPDLYGAQPQLSLDIARNGQVVGRAALPFNDKIRNDTTETSGMSSTIGEQKHEFPYLASLRGAKFSAGDYEARVTIRQNRAVVTRVAAFHVLGDRSTDVEPAGSGLGGAAPAEEDNAEVTMPEVDPANMNEGAAAPPAADQQRLWDEAAASALSYARRLPNFRCNRETRRLTASVKSSDSLRERDAIIEELTYENGNETYRTITVNGEKSSARRSAREGVRSRGEFGSMLKSIFRPGVADHYRWSGSAMSGGALCHAFDVQVPAKKSNFILTFSLSQAVASYNGRVFIDEETGLVRRIVLQGFDLPKDFALQSPTLSLEYGMVRIGDRDHLLPLRSVLQVRRGKQVIRNETLFRDYRKFDAQSEIKFQ